MFCIGVDAAQLRAINISVDTSVDGVTSTATASNDLDAHIELSGDSFDLLIVGRISLICIHRVL